MSLLQANNPALISWVPVEKGSHFPIQNLPFGIFKAGRVGPRVGVAIGDKILDLAALHKHGFLNVFELPDGFFETDYLNDFIALGKQTTRAMRNRISHLLNIENQELQSQTDLHGMVFHSQSGAEMLMPVKVGDYTDFYSSMEHATNVGTMFRDPSNALLPNWKHLPVGYHGRASSIVVTGTPVHRPLGQTKADDQPLPSFGPTKQLDFELEMAFIIGKNSPLGTRITTDQADEFIFGMVIFNDWSARDIQKWEYVPLGPFLAKNFASSVSPWVVTLDALEPFRVEGYKQDPEVLPYLKYTGNKNIDINLEVSLQTKKGATKKICSSNYRYMYWNMNQQLAHHTVNGCNVHVGDMMASGTISGPTEDSYGSMLELTWKGTKPIAFENGETRKFLEDGDTLSMKAFAQNGDLIVGFGEVSGTILPVLD